MLEDGSFFEGEAFGSKQVSTGEIMFSTGTTGYQEVISDQANTNQIIVFTAPSLGNYGIDLNGYESLAIKCRGVVCHELSCYSGQLQKKTSLDDFLKQNKIPGITKVDTRRLMRILQRKGRMKGCIVNSIQDKEHTVEQLTATVLTDQLVEQVSTKQSYFNPGIKRNVLVIDCGVKNSILRELGKRGCNTIVTPYTVTTDEIFKLQPDGILISNGPGNPESLTALINVIKDLIPNFPMMGIGLGHQLICLASGAKTYRLKQGHQGFSYPVCEIATNEILLTAQNHNYTVDKDSLKQTNLIPTYMGVDHSEIEGIRHRDYPVFSVQFYPGSGVEPHDTNFLYEDFIRMIDVKKRENDD